MLPRNYTRPRPLYPLRFPLPLIGPVKDGTNQGQRRKTRGPALEPAAIGWAGVRRLADAKDRDSHFGKQTITAIVTEYSV